MQDAIAAMPMLATDFEDLAHQRFYVDLDPSSKTNRSKQFHDFLTSEDIDDP